MTGDRIPVGAGITEEFSLLRDAKWGERILFRLQLLWIRRLGGVVCVLFASTVHRTTYWMQLLIKMQNLPESTSHYI